MDKRLKPLLIILVVLAGLIYAYEASAQSGCTDSLACNFDSSAATDDGSCSYTAWYIPEIENTGNALQACTAPDGYVYADQSCIEQVILNDTYCDAGSWDATCQSAFEACLVDPGCTNSLACNYNPAAVDDDGSCAYTGWFIPYIDGTGPAIQACEAPQGYMFLTPQTCMETVVAQDSFCHLIGWDNFCFNSMISCLECAPSFFIPVQAGFGPPIYSCQAPAGYVPANYACIGSMITTPGFKFSDIWDESAQAQYESCLGCAPQLLIPVEINTGPIIYDCTAPAGYVFGDQEALALLIMMDGFCVSDQFDQACYSLYTSILGCEPQFYIPEDNEIGQPGIGPLVYGCEQPEGYVLADYQCMSNTIQADPFCVNVEWDSTCSNAYNSCLYGCQNPQWYTPVNLGTDPAYYGCESPGYEALVRQDCVEQVVNSDSYCINNFWDGPCLTAYENCAFGCTDATACNYDPSAIGDDGSCIPSGCNDPSACNYDVNAGCSDGSCTYEFYWYVPVTAVGPALELCEINDPENYMLASQSCAQAVVDEDDFCGTIGWDDSCDSAYRACLMGITSNGCTYPDASNYDPSAYVDNGSCLFEGGADVCPQDINNDGIINTGDLTNLLAAFGGVCP